MSSQLKLRSLRKAEQRDVTEDIGQILFEIAWIWVGFVSFRYGVNKSICVSFYCAVHNNNRKKI